MRERWAVVLAGLRRFAILLVLLAAGTAVLGLLFGVVAGASVDRSVSLGFYVVGCFLLVAGFFFGNRGPVRLKGAGAVPFFGPRMVRWATPEERMETMSDSAIFVVLGVVLILIGIAVDSRTGFV